MDEDPELTALKDDYRESYRKYLKGEGEYPQGLEFPELTEKELLQLQEEAKVNG